MSAETSASSSTSETSAGLRSGQLADAAGVNPQTLRYYERRGLLPEPERTLGGHRVYPPDAVALLRVIKAAQRLGFSLDEVAELLEAGRHHHGRDSGGLQARAAAKLAEIDARIADLQVIRAALVEAVDAGCDDLTACATSDCCPLPFTELAIEERRARRA
ncbi:MerR family transcriptional regulator [Yinghuangia seranimata]|uniref:MerR family transcriptional regulator n=1 Tax=Yinghuangia seranimata TaxID=408067 RepID=UPI00248BFDB0|nr:MerR family transcriptional regulator [Yinghuangia seranimata]MDI2129043.1 MerR family transcriptional regulator [Yinghuangia seranimata]